MRGILKIFAVFVVALMLCVSSASAEGKKEAEEKEKRETKLEEIVVTATRTPKELEDVPASTSLITKKDIEKKNIQTIDKAVDGLPGVFHRDPRNLMSTWPRIFLRGIPGQMRTLVLLDGVPLNEPLNGGVRFAGYAPEEIERIEVIRGPFSSLYGGYAMGGVVNFITPTPEKQEFTLRTGYGSGFKDGDAPDIGRFYISYGNKLFDKLSIFLSYSRNSAKDFATDFNVQAVKPPDNITGWSQTTNQFGALRYLIGDQGNNDWWDDKITLKVGYDFSKTTKLNLLFVRTRLEWDPWGDGATTYLRDSSGNPVWSYGTVRESSFILTPSMGSVINFYNLSYETQISDMKAKLSMGLVDAQKRRHATHSATATRFDGPAIVSHSPSEGYIAELVFTKPLLTNHIITFGGAFKYDWAEIKRYNLTNWRDKNSITNMVYHSTGKANTYALFIQDEIMILSNLTAYIGARYDWWKTFDGYDNDIGKTGYPKEYGSKTKNSLSPKAAIVYKPYEKTTLRVSIGKAFRPPVIAELYGTFLRADLATNWGNPDLKPESVVSWDLGVSQELWKDARVRVTYFENYMKDFIQNTQIDATTYRWLNVEKAGGRGIEFEVEQKFGNWLRLFANFTYNHTEVKENKAFPKTVGKKLTEVPKTMFNGGVDFEKGLFSASLIGRHKSKIYLNTENLDTAKGVYNSYDPHFVADAKFSYKITKWATASISVNNIFDKEYFVGPKAAGRSWFADITVKF